RLADVSTRTLAQIIPYLAERADEGKLKPPDRPPPEPVTKKAEPAKPAAIPEPEIDWDDVGEPEPIDIAPIVLSKLPPGEAEAQPEREPEPEPEPQIRHLEPGDPAAPGPPAGDPQARRGRPPRRYLNGSFPERVRLG